MSERICLGFGLLEILIGLMLSSLILIMLGRYAILIQNQATHINNLFAEDIELRRVTDMLRTSIWQAGFTPCLNVDRLISIDQRKSPTFVHAIDFIDGININRMNPRFSEIISWDDRQTITLDKHTKIMLDHAVIIADCEHAEVQSISSIYPGKNGTKLRLERASAFTYTPPVYVGEWIEERFFVQKKSGKVSALFYKWHHVDRLTDLVHALSAQAINLPLGRLIKVTLGLDQSKTLDVYATVRAR